MTAPPALLSFFRQEATEYLDQLDQLLAGGAEAGPPDAAALLSHARALRGSATMTRLHGLPDLATTVERIAAGLRDGELRWDQRLHFAVRGALVELRALVGRATQWTEADQRQARTQSVALAAVAAGYLAPTSTSTSPASPVVPISRLFPSDGQPGIVERNPNPPITLSARFRSDMAAAADGVAREAETLIAAGRGPQEIAVADGVRRALLGVADVADSYAATSVSSLATTMARAALDRAAERSAVQAFARLLMDRELSDAELAARVREQSVTWPGAHSAPATLPQAVRSPTPIRQPTPVRQGTPAPPATPIRSATPASAELPIVPIETLLYRGPRALERAKEVHTALRDAWQHGDDALAPTTGALLDELSDLLTLAAEPA